MNRVLLITGLVLGLVACGPKKAPTTPTARPPVAGPTSELPSADAVFEQAIEASGGREALAAVQSFRLKGRMEMPAMGISMPMTRWQVSGRALTHVEMSGVGLIREGFDGEVAWSEHPVTGPGLKDGAELAEERRNADLQAVLNFRDLYPTRTVKGEVQHAGKPCWELEVVTDDGQRRTLYYAVEDGFPMGSKATVPTEMGMVPMTTSVLEVGVLGGLPTAKRTRIDVGAMSMVLVVDAVTYDLPDSELPDFGPPESVQALQAELEALPE